MLPPIIIEDINRLENTLGETVVLEGIGLHSGTAVRIVLQRAEPGTGIRFVRTDLASRSGEICADFRNVHQTTLCTVLSNSQGATVSTTEHLMCALWASGIDNARITINGPEIPILDGSASPFFEALKRAGTVEQTARRRVARVTAPLRHQEGEAWIAIEPAEHLSVELTIRYDHPMIGEQSFTFDAATTMPEQILPARTFALEEDIEKMRAHGLALGGSLDNAMVFGRNGSLLNDGGWRLDQECARHKVLDCLGDLYLAGHVLGKITGYASGHRMNHRLLCLLFGHA